MGFERIRKESQEIRDLCRVLIRRRPGRALRKLEDCEAMSFNARDSGTGAAWFLELARWELLFLHLFHLFLRQVAAALELRAPAGENSQERIGKLFRAGGGQAGH